MLRRLQMDSHFAGRPLHERSDGQELGGHQARRLIVFFQFAAHEQHGVGFDEYAVLAERLREHDDLDAAVDVIQHEHRHAVALARLQRPQARNDAGHPDVGL